MRVTGTAAASVAMPRTGGSPYARNLPALSAAGAGTLLAASLVLGAIGTAPAVAASGNVGVSGIVCSIGTGIAGPGEVVAESVEVPRATYDASSPDIGDRTLNAFRVYSVLKSAGCSDVGIAAALSCFQAECGIDPTAVEAIYSEPFQIGPRKASASADLPGYTETSMVSAYRGWGNLHERAYVSHGRHWAGIGIGSATGPLSYALMSAAAANGYDWYDTGFQTAVILAYGGARGEDGIDGFVAGDYGGTYAACRAFMTDYEGVPSATGSHSIYADSWLEEMSSWVPDKAYGDRYVGLAKSLRSAGRPS